MFERVADQGDLQAKGDAKSRVNLIGGSRSGCRDEDSAGEVPDHAPVAAIDQDPVRSKSATPVDFSRRGCQDVPRFRSGAEDHVGIDRGGVGFIRVRVERERTIGNAENCTPMSRAMKIRVSVGQSETDLHEVLSNFEQLDAETLDEWVRLETGDDPRLVDHDRNHSAKNARDIESSSASASSRCWQ